MYGPAHNTFSACHNFEFQLYGLGTCTSEGIAQLDCPNWTFRNVSFNQMQEAYHTKNTEQS
jgi:hypothetical protein